MENGKYTRRKRVKGTAEFWKSGNIPAEKEGRIRQDFEKWEIYPYKKMKKYGYISKR